MEMRKVKLGAACAYSAFLALGILGSLPSKAAASEVLVTEPMAAEHKRTAFRKSMRKLWAEHMIWTRAYIVATVAVSPEVAEVEKRLLRNQIEIGAIFSPYYGAETAAKLSQLLKEDVLIAAEVVTAAKKKNDVKLAAAEKRWHDNAREIAVLLSAVNPSWSKEPLTAMFDNLMTLTYKETMARIGKKWAEDIQSFDELYVEGMILADDIADGIIKQYPDKI